MKETASNSELRRPSLMEVDARTEILLMGYVQLQGTFTLDSSLLSLISFEDTKKQGIIGGQDGGGVVGLNPVKHDKTFLGSLGWSNLSQSLGGLIGSHEPSSIRDMKGAVNTKAIPIISTPQSVLFVDMKLKAGESRSFHYKHPLPVTLPPSCKGRAMKVSYNLTIGIQRPNSVSQLRHLRSIIAPFRVLPVVSGMLLLCELL